MSDVQTYNRNINDLTEINEQLYLHNDQIKLEILEGDLRKNYLTELTEREVAPCPFLPAEDDFIENIRLYHVEEMVCQKGEHFSSKLTTVFNTLYPFNASVFIILDSDGNKTDLYLGVRNNEENQNLKYSTVSIGDTLISTLIGHFPGIKISSEYRNKIKTLSDKVQRSHSLSSVSVVADTKAYVATNEDTFVQGLEKLAIAMHGRKYTGIVLAESQSTDNSIENLRKSYQDLYTEWYPKMKTEIHNSKTEKTNHLPFSKMKPHEKAAVIASVLLPVAGVAAGAVLPGNILEDTLQAGIGYGLTSTISGFLNRLAPDQEIVETHDERTEVYNKEVADLLQLIDENLLRIREFDSYGLWNVAAYFVSDDTSTAEIAAYNYRALMNGDNSGRQVSAINSWNCEACKDGYPHLVSYLARFIHPKFFYAKNERGYILTDASVQISGKELGLHLGLPRTSIPGFPIVQHAEFGKEANIYSQLKDDGEYRLLPNNTGLRPDERISLGRVFDLGQITAKEVELKNKSLTMHTFVTGSTGSGKSNTVYQILSELYQDHVPFLVVEPAKGEYKDKIGGWEGVNILTTTPGFGEVLKLNPFYFPDSIHLLEHVDGLTEIFNVCWTMYDAMSAFLKKAIIQSYEYVGWDIETSIYDKEESAVRYPDFEILAEQLESLIEESDYSAEVTGNYKGALITRVRSLATGLNKYIFSSDPVNFSLLFDSNCILDISRIRSMETKSLIMGLIVYFLNEYRTDQRHNKNRKQNQDAYFTAESDDDSDEPGLSHVTVLEEAHHLLKNISGYDSSLIQKSVEMLTQTIAEIRTYGEGFVIVDQSPSSVDASAIKNTNTKIVLRTPEENDRISVGRSMGLNNDQISEIAKLPKGVAVVYQNDWVTPVLTKVNKAAVSKYRYAEEDKKPVKTQRDFRTLLIQMILQKYTGKTNYTKEELLEALEKIDINRNCKAKIHRLIEKYVVCGNRLDFRRDQEQEIKELLRALLGLSEKDFKGENADELETIVKDRIRKKLYKFVPVICDLIK